jgi:hypothetical protein
MALAQRDHRVEKQVRAFLAAQATHVPDPPALPVVAMLQGCGDSR